MYMSKFLITHQDVVAAAGGSINLVPASTIVGVTADEAANFCKLLNGRLPTSADFDKLGDLKFAPHFTKVLAWSWTSTPDTDESLHALTLRGGSWYNEPRDAHASNRHRGDPGKRYEFYGFRCVWDRYEKIPPGMPCITLESREVLELRAELADLKQQLEQHKKQAAATAHRTSRPRKK